MPPYKKVTADITQIQGMEKSLEKVLFCCFTWNMLKIKFLKKKNKN